MPELTFLQFSAFTNVPHTKIKHGKKNTTAHVTPKCHC